MKVGLYARVSTRDKQNPEVQLRELREYAAKRGWEVTGEFVAVNRTYDKDAKKIKALRDAGDSYESIAGRAWPVKE